MKDELKIKCRKKNLSIYKDKWTELYNSGMSMREIASEYNVSKTSVIKILRGIEKRPKTNMLIDDIRQEVINMYLTGNSINNISKKFKSSDITIKQILLEENLLDINNALENITYPEYLSFIEEKYNEGLSLSKIANQLPISKSTIMYYLMLLDVKRRNYEESSHFKKINSDYFDILSRKKAVILGFFIAELQIYEYSNSMRYNCRYWSTIKKEKIITNIFSNFVDSVKIVTIDTNQKKIIECCSKKISKMLLNLEFKDIKEFQKEVLTGAILSSGRIYSREQLVININEDNFKSIICEILTSLNFKYSSTKSSIIIGKKEKIKMQKIFPCISKLNTIKDVKLIKAIP